MGSGAGARSGRQGTYCRYRLPGDESIMSKPYLEVTYRDGKPLAAYLYFNRKSGDKSVRTEQRGPYLVDYAADGRAIGVELIYLLMVDLDELNRLLAEAQQPMLSRSDLKPLIAA